MDSVFMFYITISVFTDVRVHRRCMRRWGNNSENSVLAPVASNLVKIVFLKGPTGAISR